MRILAVPSEATGREQLDVIAKRRRQRGYVEISGDVVKEAALIHRARAAVTPESAHHANHGPDDLFLEDKG